MGSIEKRERSKNPYRARVSIEGEVSQASFRTKREAQAWITEQEAAKLKGTAVSSQRGRMLYGDLLDEWLAMRAKRGAATGKPAPSTLAQEADYAEKHLRPAWGRKRIASIRRAHVQDWVDDLSADGLKAGTVARLHGIFRLTMKEAVLREYLGATPCTDISIPEEKVKMRVLDDHEVWGLADAMDGVAPCYRTLILVLGFEGLRLGEAIALTPEDVDLEAGTISVTKSVTMVKGRSRLREEPKSSAGLRDVDLLPSTVEALADHLERFSTRWLVFPPPADAKDPASATGPTYLQHGNFRRRFFQKAVERAQEAGTMKPGPLRPHDLRHTAISLRYRSDPGNHLAISRWAGHSKSSFTMDRYGKVYAGAESESRRKQDEQQKAAREATNVVPIRRAEG